MVYFIFKFGYASGTTAVVALSVNDWDNTKMYVAHVGDSGCIISDYLVQYTNMTKDHKPKNEPELSRILAAGGIVANGRVNHDLNMSRALGNDSYISHHVSNNNTIFENIVLKMISCFFPMLDR